jgi:energy-coupling factor transporter ATP-binding protein EcfA2
MFSTYEGAKRRARALQRALMEMQITLPLHQCQSLVATAADYADWHELQTSLNRPTPALSAGLEDRPAFLCRLKTALLNMAVPELLVEYAVAAAFPPPKEIDGTPVLPPAQATMAGPVYLPAITTPDGVFHTPPGPAADLEVLLTLRRLLIVGDTGCGKSVFAQAVALAVQQKIGARLVFVGPQCFPSPLGTALNAVHVDIGDDLPGGSTPLTIGDPWNGRNHPNPSTEAFLDIRGRLENEAAVFIIDEARELMNDPLFIAEMRASRGSENHWMLMTAQTVMDVMPDLVEHVDGAVMFRHRQNHKIVAEGDIRSALIHLAPSPVGRRFLATMISESGLGLLDTSLHHLGASLDFLTSARAMQKATA